MKLSSSLQGNTASKWWSRDEAPGAGCISKYIMGFPTMPIFQAFDSSHLSSNSPPNGLAVSSVLPRFLLCSVFPTCWSIMNINLTPLFKAMSVWIRNDDCSV